MTRDLDDSTRPTRAEIRLGALGRNIERARKLAGPGVKVMGVVKANAYGHGSPRMAIEMLDRGVDYLGVAIAEEALALREAGLAAPILVLGSPPDSIMPALVDAGVEFTVPSAEKARAAEAAAAGGRCRARVHLKIDTGMERLGEHWYSAERFLDTVFSLSHLEVVGVYSHFATSDCDIDFARVQLARFLEVLGLLESRGRRPPLAHIANSAALAAIPESRLDMVRPGIFLYGYENSPDSHVGLEPVMRLISQIAFVKTVRAGARVSYGGIWTAERDTRIATIPVGYGDGYSRSLSNRAEVLVSGRRVPVVGRICMDQLMVDLGPEGREDVGEEVLLFGVRGNAALPGEELCRLMGTIPYELTCMVSERVPRIYVEE
jgi:alanine racemase